MDQCDATASLWCPLFKTTKRGTAKKDEPPVSVLVNVKNEDCLMLFDVEKCVRCKTLHM